MLNSKRRCVGRDLRRYVIYLARSRASIELRFLSLFRDCNSQIRNLRESFDSFNFSDVQSGDCFEKNYFWNLWNNSGYLFPGKNIENFEFSGISLAPGKIRKFSCNFIGAQGFKKKIFSDNFALILNSRQAK